METTTVRIAGIPVGPGHPVCVAAEICTYFGTDIGLAREYIDVAKEAGVEFLKSEILHDLSIIHDGTMTHTYATDTGWKTENYRKLLARKCVSLKDYEKVIVYAQDLGMPFIASVYDLKGVDFLVSQQAGAVKTASQHITNRPLIEHCAKSGLPFIMDTGNALLHEVAAAVQWAEDCGAVGLILNHRPDGNPCPADRHNMRIMQSHAEIFGWPVGLSCHYDGDEMAYLAVGMGASLIEKPLYHKPLRDDQDTMFCLQFDEFKEMVRKIRNCSAALGDGVRRELIPGQLETRLCIVAAEDIPGGTPFGLGNVQFAWPMAGIPSACWHEVEGLRAARDLKKGIPLRWGDVDGDITT